MRCAIYNNLQFAHGIHEVVSDSLPDGGDVVLGEREMLLDALRDVACEAQGERPAVQAIALPGRLDPFELPAAVQVQERVPFARVETFRHTRPPPPRLSFQEPLQQLEAGLAIAPT